MKVSIKTVIGLVFVAASVAFGQEATVTIEGGGNNATFSGSGAITAAADLPDAVRDAGGANGAAVFSLNVTTESDILLFDAEFTSVGDMNTAGGWYNETATGTDVNPPNPAFLPVFPQLGFDTWVTTPGATAAAGANTLNGGEGARLVTHSDSTDEGAQTDFNFAQVTLLLDADGNANATLTGVVQTSASPTPIFDNFSADLSVGGDGGPPTVPEPSSMGLLLAAMLGGLSIVRKRR